jgi:anti-anti-sigma factor
MAMTGDLRMRMFTVASGVYLSAAGQLDHSTAYLLHRVVSASLHQFGTTTIAVDVSGIAFIDAHGVSMLAVCRAEAHARSVRFTLANPTQSVRRMIAACGADDLLDGVLVTDHSDALTPALHRLPRSGICRRPPRGPRRPIPHPR